MSNHLGVLTVDLGETMQEIEKKVILTVYQQNLKNVTQTAKSLGLGVRTIQRKLSKYGVPPGGSQNRN